MAYGPDTAKLLELISTIQDEVLSTYSFNLTNSGEFQFYALQITGLPQLPKTLKTLECSHTTQLCSLPKLPKTLLRLDCSYTQLCSLPKLPKTLISLTCGNTPLNVLPKLPVTLTFLECSNTQLSVLPKLPERLTWLICENTPLKLQRNAGESIADYSKRWDDWRTEQAYIARCKEKCLIIRDELADVVESIAFSSEFILVLCKERKAADWHV